MTDSFPGCGVCGRPRSAKALKGLCRHCLLRVSLGLGDHGPEPAGGPLFEAAEAGPIPESHPGGFADYELRGVLARGGMGVVYRAWQRGLNRPVAIKMIGAGLLARPEDLTRFRTEAEAVARLHHPNIVAIYEVGEHDGQPWFSMQYVAGPSLAAVVRAAPLVPVRAAMVMHRVCDAIQHAHERGILHRDLKPSNLLLDENDEPRVTDFGVAKFAQRESDVTGTDRVIGSPSYMAPEQAAGHSREVDARCDVYSLGAVLYELLTGRPPFQAETPVQTLKLVVDAEPVPPRQLNATIPVDLETICLKCLAKEPARRYQAAREVGEELAAFLGHRPIRARPTSRWELVGRWSRRNTGLAGALAALSLALVAGLAGTTWQWRRAEARRLELAAQNYHLLVARAVAEQRSGRAGQRFAALEALRQASLLRPGEPELRDEAVTTLGLVDFQVEVVRKAGPAEVQRMSPDFRFAACGTTNGSVRVYSLADPSVPAVLEEPGSRGVVTLGFSGDARWLWVTHSDGRMCLWDWRNRLCAHRGTDPALRPVVTPLFTPDSRHLVYARAESQVNVLSVTEGTARSLEVPFAPRILAVSPLSDHIAITAWDGPAALCLVRLATGEIDRRLELPPGVVANVGAWSADGHWLATAGLDLKTYLFRPADSAAPVRVLSVHDNQVTSLTFDPASSMVASSSWDGTTRFFGLADARPLVWWRSEARDLRFSPEGDDFSFRGTQEEIVVGRFEGQKLCQTLGGGEVPAALEGMHHAAFSADGHWLTSASAAGVRIFDVAEGRLRETLTAEPCGGAWLSGNRAWVVDSRGTVTSRGWPAEPAVAPGSAAAPTVVTREEFRDLTDLAGVEADGRCVITTLWGRASFQFRDHPKVLLGPVGRVDFSALNRTGLKLVLNAGDRREVWDTALGQKQLTLPRRGIRGAACLDTAGSRLCCRELTALTCYEVPSGRVLWSVPRPTEGLTSEMQWSADDRRIVVQSGMSEVELLAAENGRLLVRIAHPEARMIRTLALSDDGRWLAVACARSILQLWDLARLRQELRPLGLDWRD